MRESAVFPRWPPPAYLRKQQFPERSGLRLRRHVRAVRACRGAAEPEPVREVDVLRHGDPPHGSYGKGKGANPKGWYYSPNEGAVGHHTYGNIPAEAMLTARDVMVERVVRIAREVWK